GRLSRTLSGRLCQRWDSQEPHPHTTTSSFIYSNLSVSGANNYCINPETLMGQLEGPGCSTMDPAERWQYCSIPLCSKFDSWM
ncbi:hypothetical protein CAPTEDRAFT_106613, partial [Capitella teleta]